MVKGLGFKVFGLGLLAKSLASELVMGFRNIYAVQQSLAVAPTIQGLSG